MTFLADYIKLDHICTELSDATNSVVLIVRQNQHYEYGYADGLECKKVIDRLYPDDFDVIRYLKDADSDEDYKVLNYIKGVFNLEDILNEYSKDDLLEYLYNNYNAEQLINLSWDY